MTVINRFLPHIIKYKKTISYSNQEIKNIQQIAIYASRMFETNYLVNVQEHFIQKVKKFTSTMIIKNLKFKGISKEYIKLLQERNRKVQDYIFGNVNINISNLYDLQIANEIKELLPIDIHKEGLAYDIVARTEKYLEPYFKLCELYKKYDLKVFNFTPLSTSSIPRHITIDTKILMENILDFRRTKENTVKSEKEFVWSTIFKTDTKAFRSRNNMSFNGMIRTDGVSICVLLSSPKPKKDDIPRVKKRKKPEKTEYFQDNLSDLRCNKVFIDPNKRDLLYCLGSNGEKLKVLCISPLIIVSSWSIELNLQQALFSAHLKSHLNILLDSLDSMTDFNSNFLTDNFAFTQMQRRKESGLKRYRIIREKVSSQI
ncbi:hypothetical protein HK099_006949, partial [Clydaea vesicula]